MDTMATLKRILSTNVEAVFGTVIAINSTGQAEVATKQGKKIYPYIGSLKKDDIVLIRDGTASLVKRGKIVYI